MIMKSAYATKIDDGTDWIVYSGSKHKLFELDKNLSEKQVMSAIHLARLSEKMAYETCTKEVSTKYEKIIKGMRSQGQAQIDELNNRIEGLSSELLRLMDED